LKIFSFFLFLTIYCGSISKGIGQIKYHSKSHKIDYRNGLVIDDVKIKGIVTDTDGATLSVSFSSLEKVKDLTLVYFENSKAKKVKQKDFFRTALSSTSFYEGIEAFQYHLEGISSFVLTYTIEKEDPMLVLTFNFYSYHPCDSIYYGLNLPVNKVFNYDLPFPIENLKIDSVKGSERNKFTFSAGDLLERVVPFRKTNYSVSDYGSKVIRVQIGDLQNRNATLNNWYQSLVKETGELNNSSKNIMDTLLMGISDKDTIVSTLLEFVQKKIKYIDIEDGINAFVPRNVNDILLKRQGDCKDMSNLLVQSLKYKGLDAYLALSSTLSHRLELDFPNIASANHVVCVVNLHDKFLVVDGTDQFCTYPNPSSHTQGRNIFVINNAGGFFHPVEKIPFNLNLDSTYAELAIINNKVSGSVRMDKTGLANRSFYGLKSYVSDNDLQIKLKRRLVENYKLFDVTNLKHNITKANAVVHFEITQRNSTITKVNAKSYLAISDLIREWYPFPIQLQEGGRIITYRTLNKKMKIKITVDTSFTLIQPIVENHTNGAYYFSFKLEQVEANQMVLTAEIVLDKVEIKESDRAAYQAFCNSIQQVIHKSIVYEEK
jgi:hypothetical protein